MINELKSKQKFTQLFIFSKSFHQLNYIKWQAKDQNRLYSKQIIWSIISPEKIVYLLNFLKESIH